MRWLALILFLASCDPAETTKPLSDPKAATVDARLVGTWVGKMDKRPVYLHVSAHVDGQMDFVLVGETDTRGAAVMHYQGHETVKDGATYLSLRAKSFPNPLADEFVLAPNYITVKLELGKDLTLSWMDDKPVAAAIAAGTLKGEKARIDDDPEKIFAFIKTSDAKKLWQPLATTFKKTNRP